MKLKDECCEKFKKKDKACKRCPITATLCKKDRKKLLKRYRKRATKPRAAAADASRAA